jgi:pilus assembly protein Flp/PilA
MANFLRAVLRDSRGATAVEYGLILALLVVALMASLSQVAITTTQIWNTIADTVNKS